MAAARAGEAFDAGVELPSGSRAWRRAGMVLLIAVSALSMGYLCGPRADVVVRRRSDRSEVVRIPAGADEQVAAVLTHVRQQLWTLDVTEFCEAWGVEPPVAGAA